MKKSSAKLPLTSEERARLRGRRIKLQDVQRLSVVELSEVLGGTLERAKLLRAFAVFQSVPSIGPRGAQWMIDLGYYSMDEIKQETGHELTNRLEQMYGCWVDPCVEDSLRCLVHHANHPDSEKSWFDFTEERKAYRQQYGYPSDRPTRAWNESNS